MPSDGQQVGYTRRWLVSIIADLLIVCLLVGTAWRLVLAYRPVQPAADEAGPLLRRTSVLDVPEVRSETSRKQVVLFVETSCVACQQSVPFYHALTEHMARTPNSRLLFLSANSPEQVRRWLGDQHVRVDNAVQIKNPSALGFSMSPTLLLLDGHGKVDDILLGKATAQQERHVLSRLSGESGVEPIDNTNYLPEIGLQEYGRTAKSTLTQAQMVDVRDRKAFDSDHISGAVNIPFDELPARAPVEMRKTEAVALACYAGAMVACRLSGHRLRELGFANVTLVVQ